MLRPPFALRPLARPATAFAATPARSYAVLNRAAERVPADARPEDLRVPPDTHMRWPEGASSNVHAEKRDGPKLRDDGRSKLIFRVKPSEIPAELVPLFAAVGAGVVGAFAYMGYKLWADKDLRIHNRP